MPTPLHADMTPDSRRRQILAAVVAVACGAVAVAVFLRSSSARRRIEKPVPVSGAVTLDGRSLPDGDVMVEGLDGSPPVHAAVADGRFTLVIPPGEKRISVNRFRNTGKKNELGYPVHESLIPERYNVATELRFQVSPDGPNDVKLELRSK